MANDMKGFTDSTKMMPGHVFAKTATHVKPHVRAMPAKKMAPPTTLSDAPMRDAVPMMSAKAPPMAKAKGGAVKRDPRSPMIKPKSGC